MAASITKFENREKFIKWLDHLPEKFSIDKIENMVTIGKLADDGKQYFIWTEKNGIKRLR